MSQTAVHHPQPKPASRPAWTATPTRSSLLQRKCACGGTTGANGECEECRKKRLAKTLQRAATQPSTLNSQPAEVPPIVHDVLRSPGQPLDPGTRAYMEPRFGHDFSQVRVHTNSHAADSARAVDALAYTVGQNVVFGSGQYSPLSHSGRRLLAHELTHVVQQAQGAPNTPMASSIQMNAPGDAYEHEADVAAQTVMEQPDRGISNVLHARPTLQRKCGSGLGIAKPDCSPVNLDPHGEIFQFQTSCDEILPSESRHMTSFLASLPPGTTLNVHGYATPDGPALEAFNWQLSCHRANAMAGILRSATPSFRIDRIFAHGPVGGPASQRQAVWVEPNSPAPVPPAPTPAPPGSAPVRPCKVDVRATHIGGALGKLPIWHLFLVYTDTTGTEYFYRGGPGGSCPGVALGGYGTIQSTAGLYDSTSIDWSPGAPSITTLAGPAACGKNSCFAAELTRIDGTCTPYSPTGPNSNTVAETLLSKCGVPVQKPVWIAPGFSDPTL